MLDTDPMRTLRELSTRFVLQALMYGLLVVPAICLCCLVAGCIYWTLMVLRRIGSEIRTSWRRLLNSGFGWSKRQKPLLPRSDYGWKAEL